MPQYGLIAALLGALDSYFSTDFLDSQHVTNTPKHSQTHFVFPLLVYIREKRIMPEINLQVS